MRTSRNVIHTLFNDKGFTLLEVLIAMALFSIIMTIVLVSFSGAMSSAEGVQKSITVYESAKGAMDRMVMDLESARVAMANTYNKPAEAEDYDPLRFVGTKDYTSGSSVSTLRFVSQAHVDLTGAGKMGLAEITYYLTPDPSDETRKVLRRRDILDWEIFGEEGRELGSDPILCERVRNIEYLFYDQDGDTTESWDSDSEETEFATPMAVDIILELEAFDEEDALPFRFETTVNLPFYREEQEW
ncbi:general secretion pathway protein J [Desulfatibacillum alkenivorans DSM 16219]|jgi:general secretion pathway protein J|uniref:General secretion pathway protein J n=1 Tax=Desulfatibacillum alkenivorans DSM 16219 TaxID=1121393 RepID=A0A1M6BWB1_9BACT|nr:type II secretion system protein [Desulfatibacillum alkenivorans]SHI53040.1 general secretion pathway protein J [Desulfatibacillum alkenivorans DSM 16219]